MHNFVTNSFLSIQENNFHSKSKWILYCILIVKDFIRGTRNFANLYVGVLITDKVGQKGGQLSMITLGTLQSLHIIPGLVPAGLRDLLVSSDIL